MSPKEPKKKSEQIDETSEEYKAGAMLLESFRKILALSEPMSRFRVLPGSALQGDDAATGYETISSQVETNIQGAIGNVEALHDLMIGANTLPAYAHFGLLRNALEMVGTGLWLLGPTSRDERVLHSLQSAMESRRDYVTAANELHRLREKFPDDDWVKLLLESQRDERAGIRTRSLHTPTISSRLSSAQEFCSDQQYTVLAYWRLTSGAMHGRRAILKDLLEHEILEHSEIGYRTSMTSGIVVVANVLRLVEVHLFELLLLLLERAGHRSSSRARRFSAD